MNDHRWRAWGPVTTKHEATRIVDALRSAGLPDRSAAIVPLDHRGGIETQPLAQWTLGRACRDARRAALLSLPFLAAFYAGLFWLRLDETTSLAITIGLVGGFGAAPVAGLIGFAHGWTRWSELTVLDGALADSTGFLVVAADLPARTLSTVRDIPPPFRAARPGRTHR